MLSVRKRVEKPYFNNSLGITTSLVDVYDEVNLHISNHKKRATSSSPSRSVF